jgi:polysaccharide pyruvyl transferase CsaB
MTMLLMGYYGAHNLGDEMMLFCLRRWLEKQDVGIKLLCEGSREAGGRFQMPAAENLPLLLEWAWRDVWLRGKAFGLLNEFRKADGLIVGGGDLVRDDRGWRVFMYTMEKILLAFFMHRPVFLLNVGIGRPATWYGRWLLPWALRRCRQIVVRDVRSLEVCREAGAEVTFIPDIVMHLPDWLEGWRNKLDRTRAYIAVCLRTTSDAFGQYKLDEIRLRNLANALDHLAVQNGLDVVFIPFQAVQGENDNDIHVEVAKRMREQSRVLIREWSGNLAEVTQYIAGAACVIAMRLHAAILAVACGRPCAIMPYDYKVSEAARSLNVTDLITPDTLANLAELTTLLKGALKSGAVAQTRGMACWDSVSLRVRSG